MDELGDGRVKIDREANEEFAAGRDESLGAEAVLGTTSNATTDSPMMTDSLTMTIEAPTDTSEQRGTEQNKYSAMMKRSKRSGKTSNKSTGSVPANSIGAVAVSGIGSTTTDPTLPPSSLPSVGVFTGTSSSITLEDPLDHDDIPTIIVAKLVPDESELEHRLQILEEERNRQVTVDAVAVKDGSAMDPDVTHTKIMGLTKRNFWRLMISLLVMISIAGIVVAVVLTRPPPVSPDVAAIDQLWMGVGDEIDKDGGSWNTDPSSTQYQALDWLANVDQWRTSLNGTISTQVLVERYALIVLLLSISKDSRPYELDSATSVCSWSAGIICDNYDEFVTELNFTKSQLRGTIPTELSFLSSLVSVNMSRNALSGTLPTELGRLTGLNTLDIRRNEFGGTIPTEFGMLTGLTILHMYDNGLTRSIPTEVGLLTNIAYFVFGDNRMTGSLPTEIGNCALLNQLSLERNQLTGTLPTEFGRLTTLNEWNTNTNSLSGTIPTEIGLLTNITVFDVSKNKMSGEIPTELGHCTALVRVGLQLNQFSGNLSDILCGGGRVYAKFWSDCDTPIVTCSCCTNCCDANQTCIPTQGS